MAKTGVHEVSVRRATNGDAVRLVELARQLGYVVSADELARRLVELAEDPHDAAFVACDARGEVLGWLHVQRARALLFEPYAEIVALVVEERVRSAGIGARLLERAESWARDHGFGVVRLRSRTTRERAHAFYLRHGYVITKTQAAFEKPLAPREA